MSTVNTLAREVSAKIVFYGPGLSGKTTTLRKIFESVRPAHRGEMMSLATEGNRTLFFDFLPVKVERVGDCSVRLALYTVPGQVFYNATRKLVLQGADGVVFVADSQPEAMDSNVESFKNLEENLAEMGLRVERFPLVFQWNKRDIPKALPIDELRQKLNLRGVPDFETIAERGVGVLDSLKAITRLVIKDLRNKGVVPSPRPASAPVDPLSGNAQGGPGLEQQLANFSDTRPPVEPFVEPPGHKTRPPGEPAAEPPASKTRPPVWPGAGAASSVVTTTRRPPPAMAGRLPLGPTTALSPGALVDYAKAADTAFLASDHPGCVRACQEAVRRGLGFTGADTPEAQAFLLGIDGRDLLRMNQLASKSPLRVDDSAFAIYLVMQVFIRLTAAGLPTPTE